MSGYYVFEGMTEGYSVRMYCAGSPTQYARM